MLNNRRPQLLSKHSPSEQGEENPAYSFLDEEATADVAYVARGSTLEEAFANAVLAMTEVMVSSDEIRPLEERNGELQAEDLQGLLYDLLDHFLFLFDSEFLLFGRIQVNLDEPNCSLKWVGAGESYDETRHQIKTHVKAVTFFGMEVGEQYVKVTLDL